MRLLSIELNGYKRLMMNQVSVFKMDLTQKIQLILGTNGSGKSSLMSELTPLPAQAADFHKGGSKIIRISHRGNSYELKSSFVSGQKHSFLKNDTELNQGQTVTAQKELVWQEFGMNEDIRNLQLGKVKFHSMRPGTRREWLTMLSDTNFDFALDVYQAIRDKSRDITGALKITKARMVNELAKIISIEEQTRLKSEVDVIHRELSELLEMRAPIEHSVKALEERQQAGLAELSQLSLKLLRTRYVAPFTAYGAEELHRNDWGELEAPHFKTLEDIDAYLVKLKERIAAEEALINQAVKDHHKLKGNLAILKKTGEEGIKSLSGKLTSLTEQRQECLKQRKLKLEGLDPQAALISFDSCQELLFEIFSTIPENEDKRFSQAKFAEVQSELKRLREMGLRFKSELDKAEAQKVHLESHQSQGAIECPTCHTRFTPGFSENALRAIKAQIDTLGAKLAYHHTQLTACEATVDAFTQYAQLYRQFTGCTRGYPALRPFWEHLENEALPVTAPRMVLGLLTTFRRDLTIELEAQALEKQIQEVRELINQAALVGNASLSDTQKELEEITLHVELMTAHLGRVRLRYQEHAEYRRQLNEALELSKRIDKLAMGLTQITTDMVETMRRETIQHCIRQLQTQLAKKEEVLNDVKMVLNLVKDLEKQIETLTQQDLALKLVAETLSPTDGLIAEGLLGFIRSFTRQMNQFIKHIWSYPLQVKECGISGEKGVELDYKFPLLVGGPENIVADVEDGSAGMRDIIDLAFVATAMKYLNLAESPLLLDEFGLTLDKEHRVNATQAIKTLMETHAFTQLFMISHYESTYGAFANAEICVLDAKNIVVPDVYNRHVTIQ